MNCTAVTEQLRRDGFALVPAAGPALLIDILEHLGTILHVEEVVVSSSSSSLVKSERGLSLHTDHHRADFIVWYCIQQCDIGGETVLADARAAYARLTSAEQRTLTSVQLQEHSVFTTDAERHPVVTLRNGVPRFYYSYWLADENMGDAERAAFEAFERAIRAGSVKRFRLQPRDVLVVDNGRVLHGRSSIRGDRARHLRRYWVELAAGAAVST